MSDVLLGFTAFSPTYLLPEPPCGSATALSQSHAGSCLCGAVKFTVEGAFERFYLCHCAYCRKDTGSAHAANLFSSSASLAWLAGHDKVVIFNLPGTRHHKSFCSVCGSALPWATARGVVVPAGSLDSPVAIQPDAHIFVASRADWDHALESAPAFAGFPG